MILRGHKSKPYYNFISKIENNRNVISLAQVEGTNTGYMEIINAHYIDDRGRKMKEKQAPRIETV